MSDTVKTDDPKSDAKEIVSRRDFLRRAGREAAATGVQIVPGAKLAQKALETDADGSPKWLRAIAGWRDRQTKSGEPNADPPAETATKEPTDG